MKKLALFLALIMVVSCFGVFVSAEAEPEADLRPIEADKTDAKIVVEGCTVETDSNGTARVTLTAAVGVVNIIFDDSEGTYAEVNSNIRDEQKYVRYYIDFGEGIETVEVHGHYSRGDKDNADLYLSGMQKAPDYFVLGGTEGGTFGVWDITKYLKDREARGYMPEDGVIRFHDNEFRITGSVGSVFTIYYYDIADSYEDDFGTNPPDDNVVDVSEEESAAPVEESKEESTAPVEESKEESAAPVEESKEESKEETASTSYSKYDFIKTASDAKVNEAVAGESVRVFLPGFDMSNSNTKWSINILLKAVAEGQYKVVSVNAGDGNNVADAIPEGHVLLAVHSSSSKIEDLATYANVEGKLAALDLQPGDKIVLEFDDTTVTKAARVKSFPSTTPKAGDAGIIALAVVSVLALGGAVVIKKSK